MGHILGSSHDGDKNSAECPASDRYIMSPSKGFDKPQNSQKFSTCSVRNFKTLLLANNGYLGFKTLSKNKLKYLKKIFIAIIRAMQAVW